MNGIELPVKLSDFSNTVVDSKGVPVPLPLVVAALNASTEMSFEKRIVEAFNEIRRNILARCSDTSKISDTSGGTSVHHKMMGIAIDEVFLAVLELYSMPRMQQWMSIETAPKNGKSFLGASLLLGLTPKGMNWRFDIWRYEKRTHIVGNNPRFISNSDTSDLMQVLDQANQPTHWMPLPVEPQLQESS